MFVFDPIGYVVDMFGLVLLRWVRKSGLRQKLLIEFGFVCWKERAAEDGKGKGKKKCGGVHWGLGA